MQKHFNNINLTDLITDSDNNNDINNEVSSKLNNFFDINRNNIKSLDNKVHELDGSVIKLSESNEESKINYYSTSGTSTTQSNVSGKALKKAQEHRAKVVTFYINGEPFSPQFRVVIVKNKDFKYFYNLLDHLTARTKLSIKYVFNDQGQKITCTDQLIHNKIYICSIGSKYVPALYGKAKNINNATINGLNELKSYLRPLSSKNKYNLRNENNNGSESGCTMNSSNLDSNIYIENIIKNTKRKYDSTLRNKKPLKTKVNERLKKLDNENISLIKGQIVTIINKQEPSNNSRVLLNLKSAQTFESIVKDLGDSVSLNDASKLILPNGNEIRSISQLSRFLNDFNIFYVDCNQKIFKNSHATSDWSNNSVYLSSQHDNLYEEMNFNCNNNSKFNNNLKKNNILPTKVLVFNQVESLKETNTNFLNQKDLQKKKDSEHANLIFANQIQENQINLNKNSQTNQIKAEFKINKYGFDISSNDFNFSVCYFDQIQSNINLNNDNNLENENFEKYSLNNQNIQLSQSLDTLISFDSIESDLYLNSSFESINCQSERLNLIEFDNSKLNKTNILDNISDENVAINNFKSDAELPFKTKFAANIPFAGLNDKILKSKILNVLSNNHQVLKIFDTESVNNADSFDKKNNNKSLIQIQNLNENLKFKFDLNNSFQKFDLINSIYADYQCEKCLCEKCSYSDCIRFCLLKYQNKKYHSLPDNLNAQKYIRNDFNFIKDKLNILPNISQKSNNCFQNTLKDKIDPITTDSYSLVDQKETKNEIIKNNDFDINDNLSNKNKSSNNDSLFNKTLNSKITADIHQLDLSLTSNCLLSKIQKGNFMPNKGFLLKRIFGYNGDVFGNNLQTLGNKEIAYFVSSFVIIWDLNKNLQKQYFEHKEEICCLAINHKLNIIASGEKSNLMVPNISAPIVRVWNYFSFKTLFVSNNLEIDAKLITVTFSDKGFLLIATSLKNELYIYLWDWYQNILLAKSILAMVSNEEVYGAQFQLFDNYSFITYGKKHLNIWYKEEFNILTKSCFKKLHESETSINCLGFLKQGNIATGDSLGKLIIWNCGKKKFDEFDSILKEIVAHDSAISSILVFPSLYIVTGDISGVLKTWLFDNVQFSLINMTMLPSYCGTISSLVISNPNMYCDGSNYDNDPDNEKLFKIYIGTSFNTILSCSILQSAQYVILYQGHIVGIRAITADPIEKHFYTAALDQKVCKWSKNNLLWFVKCQYQSVSICVYPSGETLAVGCINGIVCIFNTLNGDFLNQINVSNCAIGCLSYSPDSLFLAAGTLNGNLHILPVYENGSSHDRVSILKCNLPILTVQWSLDCKFILTSVNENEYQEIVLWDIINSKCIKGSSVLTEKLEWYDGTCSSSDDVRGTWENENLIDVINLCCHFSPSGEYVVTGDEKGNIRLFTYPCLDNKAGFFYAKQGSSAVTEIRFFKDSRSFISSNFDGSLFLWEFLN